MKIYRNKNYNFARENDPEFRPPNYASREDFCCTELFESNCVLFIDGWNGELCLRVLEEEYAELVGIRFCLFCGEKFEIEK